MKSGLKARPNGRKDGSEHFFSENAGVRVVTRAMIAVEKGKLRSNRVHCAVRERDPGPAHPKGSGHAVVGNPPKCNDRFQIGHQFDRSDEIGSAGTDFVRPRLVFGRETSHRVGHCGICQRQPVVRRGFVSPGRKAECNQRLVEEVASVVAGKRATSAVGTTQARCKANDQKLGTERAERRDRCVVP